jgi:hypothetical protein
MTSEKIEFSQSNKIVILMLLMSIIIVITGIWCVIEPYGSSRYSPLTIRVSGIVNVLIFVFYGVMCIKKLFDKNAGFIVDSSGITDKSSGSVGYIPWKDIIGIKTFSKHWIVISVNNPREYINRQKKLYRKKILEENYNNHGSPIVLNTMFWNCKHLELERILKEQYKRYGNNTD